MTIAQKPFTVRRNVKGKDGKSVHMAYMSLGGMLCREHASFTLSVESVVGFGIGDTWVVKRLSAGTYAANSSLFGRDPALGKGKAAYMTVFSTEMFAGAVYMGTCTDTNGPGPSDLTLYKWGRIKGEPGVNPACYRLVQDGNGMCTAGLVLGSDASGKPKVSVEMAIDLSFSIYKFVGDSAERLGSSKDFAAESVFVPAGKATYGGITLETVNTGDGFDVGCDDTVSETDIENTLIDMSAVKVTLKQGGKVWDTVTVPVTTAQDQAYSRTKAMMESIYTNQTGLSVIKHQADSISAMVYAHGTNMLYDAGFTDSTPNLDGTMRMRRFQTSAGNTVSVNGDGTLTISASGNTDYQYTGVYWFVPIEALGFYTASVEVVSSNIDDGSFAIYTASADRVQEPNQIGYTAINKSSAGKRVSVTTSKALTESDLGKCIEVYVVVPQNGTIKIKCPQLERGKEATTWTLRGLDDGLIKAGVDVERGTVTQYGDRFKWMDATGKNMIAGISDGNATFNGIVHAKGGEFTGKVIASQIEGTDITGGTITGAKISGITGSFDKLQSASNANNNIGFDKDGFFVSGYFRTYNSLSVGQTLSAGYSYLGAVYAGSFSCFERVTMVVSYGQATVYGKAGGAVTYSLRSKTTSNGESYYEIECYDIPAITGQTAQRPDSLAGIAIDTIIFRDLGGGYYNYHVMLLNYQKVRVIAANNNRKGISIFRNGSLVGLGGGSYFSIFQLDPNIMTPVPASGLLGRGQLWSANENNDW